MPEAEAEQVGASQRAVPAAAPPPATVAIAPGSNGAGAAAPASTIAPSVQGAALGKLQRTVEILRILYKNDFFGMMRDLARAERAPRGPRGRGGELAIPPDVPRKVRRILEQLGPTFVKIGQLLGTRPDLVPKAFVDEFKNLYDKTTPNPFWEIKAQIERELGRPMDEVFLEFSETPVASASVGQVHFATLRSGEKVAVKVQHPGIEQRVFTDFEILEPMVRFVENLFAASRVWQPREHVNEVFEMLVKELDYRYEARNHQKVYDAFAGDSSVKIPKIYWEYSAKRVLCLERIVGIKLSDFSNPDLKALNGRNIARIITTAMAKQIFEDRLFHADPSPGNLMAMSSDQVAFLDFGAVGKVTRRRAAKILDMLMGFVRGEVEAIRESLIAICNIQGELPNPQALDRDIEKIMDYHERERASPADPVVLEMTIEVASRHRMLLPPDFMLITRALFQFEGLCKKLDPEYELVEVLEPYVKEFVRKETLKGSAKEAFLDVALESAKLARTLPHRMNAIVRKFEQNDFRVKIDMADLRESHAQEDRRNLRGTFTTLVASEVVGIALVIGLGRPEFIVPFLFASAVFVILWAFVMLYWSD